MQLYASCNVHWIIPRLAFVLNAFSVIFRGIYIILLQWESWVLRSEQWSLKLSNYFSVTSSELLLFSGAAPSVTFQVEHSANHCDVSQLMHACLLVPSVEEVALQSLSVLWYRWAVSLESLAILIPRYIKVLLKVLAKRNLHFVEVTTTCSWIFFLCSNSHILKAMLC